MGKVKRLFKKKRWGTHLQAPKDDKHIAMIMIANEFRTLGTRDQRRLLGVLEGLTEENERLMTSQDPMLFEVFKTAEELLDEKTKPHPRITRRGKDWPPPPTCEYKDGSCPHHQVWYGNKDLGRQPYPPHHSPMAKAGAKAIRTTIDKMEADAKKSPAPQGTQKTPTQEKDQKQQRENT